MATQVKDKQAGKNDAFIEAQLALAQNRVRLVDVLSAVLGFLGGTLAFAILMILLDKRFVLSDAMRQFAFLIYIAGAAAYMGFTIVRPLRWRVNPHYAARQIEGTLPGTRNHVINWIDLHTEKVPSVLKSTLGQKAAKDLSRADIDTAISNRRAFLVGSLAGILLVVLLTLFFLFGPAPFASLMGRAFAPFGAEGIASRTQVAILRPQDTTVTIGNAVTIVAQVGGRVPDARDKDAPCLLYRHDESEPYRKRFLQADESNQEWASTISPIDVGNGFFYKVAAGDAETPEYEVKVRATPLLDTFEAKYHYRSYVCKADHTRTTRKLEDLRGTEVVITAWTNRTIKDGRLEFDGADGVGDLIRTERVDNEPKALRFHMVLDRGGKYRIRFTSTDDETYIDPVSYDVAVFLDNPPQVRLTEPAKDVTLPANGQLEVKGEASDDFGIAAMSLQMHIVGGTRLQPRPYLPNKLGTQGFGTPLNLDYSDLLELSSLKRVDGKPLELKPGTEIEYWLQAADACDYLRPNVTDSRPRWKIKIAEADKNDAQKQKEREEANARQKEHEAKQAEQLKKEQAEREKKKKEEQEQEDRESAERKKGKSNSENAKTKDKEGGNTKPKDTRENKPNEDSEPKNPKNEPKDKGKSPKDQSTTDKAEQLKKELEKQEGKNNNKDEQDKRGEARGADKRPGKGKDQGEKKTGKEEGKDNKPGESRDEGGQDSKNPAGSKKEEGSKAGEKGSARGESRPEPGTPKGEGKQQAAKTEAGKQPGQSKECPAPSPGPGAAKSGGTGDPSKSAGERKSEGTARPGDQAKQGEGRDSGSAGKPNEQKPGEGKQGANAGAAAPKGQAKVGGPKAGSSKSAQREDGNQEPGENKPAGSSGDASANKGDKKDSGKKQDNSRGSQAKRSDVEDLIKKMNEGDAKKREEAKRDLQDVKDNAQDAQARQAAEEALEQDRQANQPGQGKPASGEVPGEKGEKKTGENAVPKESGTAKDGQSRDAGEKGSAKDAGKKKNQAEGAPKDDGNPGQSKGTSSAPGSKAGNSASSERTPGFGSGNDAMAAKSEKEVPHRATMLQLEEFRKKVDKNILKDMKMSPEEFAKFLKDYEELAKRPTREATDAPEAIARPQAGGTLPNIASRSSANTKGGTNDSMRNDGRPQAPPGYRESYADFLRRLRTKSADDK